MEKFLRPRTLVVKRDEGTVSPSFDNFIMEANVDILFLDNKLIDKYLDDVYAVAKDIVNNYLSIAEKTKLLIDKKYHHFGMGLWIRNNFIYPNHSFNEYEPDEMSSHVHETIIAILESNKNKGKISFYDLSGKLKSKVRMDKENIGKTHGMMVRCFLTDNTILDGFCYAFSEIEPDKVSDIVLEKNKTKIKMPNRVPTITGYAFLETREWGGNGISANVNFSVTFGGDIKSLSIERSGNLAKWVGKDTFVLDLQGKSSPYIFTYELHLEDGDNYVPVTITDLRGNKTEYKFNVACTMTRNNSQDINIDNNVNVNVW